VGGKSSKNTTSTYTPPSWIEDTSKQAIGIGQRIGNAEFQEYQGQRVAGLSKNEKTGMNLARDSVGIGDPYFNKAADYAESGTQSWTDADQSKYINPYVEHALDPAARKIGEAGQHEANRLDSRASSMNAFGGSRAALMRSENQESTLEGISDLYKEGYAAAYESGVNIFGAERAKDMEAAGRFMEVGGAKVDAAQTDISTLMTTGATDRGIEQSMLDFDWGQFVEERDWDFRQLMGVISALEGTKGSYSTTQTSETEVEKDNTAEVVGAIAQIVSSAYGAGSDEKLKDNITFLGWFMGQRIYSWTWNALAKSFGICTPTIGVIAQEVGPEFTFTHPSDGYLMVNYRKLFGVSL
jgi:hypothetical protein